MSSTSCGYTRTVSMRNIINNSETHRFVPVLEQICVEDQRDIFGKSIMQNKPSTFEEDIEQIIEICEKKDEERRHKRPIYARKESDVIIQTLKALHVHSDNLSVTNNITMNKYMDNMFSLIVEIDALGHSPEINRNCGFLCGNNKKSITNVIYLIGILQNHMSEVNTTDLFTDVELITILSRNAIKYLNILMNSLRKSKL